MIDAGKGFVKDGNKNRLREQDIYRIVTTLMRLQMILNMLALFPIRRSKKIMAIT